MWGWLVIEGREERAEAQGPPGTTKIKMGPTPSEIVSIARNQFETGVRGQLELSNSMSAGFLNSLIAPR